MGGALLLCEKELTISSPDTSLVVQGVERVEVGKQERVEPFALLVVEGASISPSGYPYPGDFGVSDNEVIGLVHHIGDRVM